MFKHIKYDCKYFKGYIPCKPNKEEDKTCDSCDKYSTFNKRILIIKLGAMGDVIRTTPLLVKFQELYPESHITWITDTPDILPPNMIQEIVKFEFRSVYQIKGMKYDIAINLDKDVEACKLLSEVDAKNKYGFTWENNHISVATEKAEHKLVTGVFDNISKENTKNYIEEIFEICHLDFNQEPYHINLDNDLANKWKDLKEKSEGKTIIGLNTGCGKRWQTRLWPRKYWIELINNFIELGFYPVLLGGPEEDDQNRYLSEKTKAYYPGYFSLKEFIAITSNCDMVISLVTMMMHIAIALKKPLVLFNNIFNKHEFELYDNGVIVEPPSGCDCYYGNTCKRDNHCMNDLKPEVVLEKVLDLYNKKLK
jgi:ADP-heptose:LPS heptosyltransferase